MAKRTDMRQEQRREIVLIREFVNDQAAVRRFYQILLSIGAEDERGDSEAGGVVRAGVGDGAGGAGDGGDTAGVLEELRPAA